MNTSHNQSQQKIRALQNTTGLSEVYLKLEGFVDSCPDKNTEALIPAYRVESATPFPESCWQEALVTVRVILSFLVTSSVALGFGVSRLSQGLQQLGDYVCHQSADSVAPPLKCRF